MRGAPGPAPGARIADSPCFALRAPMSAVAGRLSGATSARCDACDEAGPVRTFVGLQWHDACFAFWQAMTAQLDS